MNTHKDTDLPGVATLHGSLFIYPLAFVGSKVCSNGNVAVCTVKHPETGPRDPRLSDLPHRRQRWREEESHRGREIHVEGGRDGGEVREMEGEM